MPRGALNVNAYTHTHTHTNYIPTYMYTCTYNVMNKRDDASAKRELEIYFDLTLKS